MVVGRLRIIVRCSAMLRTVEFLVVSRQWCLRSERVTWCGMMVGCGSFMLYEHVEYEFKGGTTALMEIVEIS